MFQLVGLPQLVKLVLANNSRVENESVTVLIAFEKMKYLDLVGTGIDMAGARRFVTASLPQDCIIILPAACGEYLNSAFSPLSTSIHS